MKGDCVGVFGDGEDVCVLDDVPLLVEPVFYFVIECESSSSVYVYSEFLDSDDICCHDVLYHVFCPFKDDVMFRFIVRENTHDVAFDDQMDDRLDRFCDHVCLLS